MKQTTLIGLVTAATLGIAAWAAELQHANIQNSQEEPHCIFIMSGREVIAEMNVKKPGTLSVTAPDLAVHSSSRAGTVYNSNGGSKVELLVEGKPVLTVSGETMIIQPPVKGSPTAKHN